MKQTRYFFYIAISVLLFGFSHVVFAQADTPCEALTDPDATLTPTPMTTCLTQTTGSLSGATNTPNIPAPGCGNYQGKDKWYTLTVPSNGVLTVRMSVSSASFANGAMAIYTALSCSGGFTLVQCNDDGSGNGLMPVITLTNQPAGQLLYIRVWRNGGGVGTFNICATNVPLYGCSNSDVVINNSICGGGLNDPTTGAQPFCVDKPVAYCNTTGVTSSGSMNCLGSTPNPAWFYLEYDQSGTTAFQIQQQTFGGGFVDVDYAFYGPFNSIAQGCSQLTTANLLACSYSSSATENVPNNAPNGGTISVQAGQIYILLVTNFSGSAGYFTMEKTNGTAVSSCQFLCGIHAHAIPDTCSQGVGQILVDSISFEGITSTELSSMTFTWDAGVSDSANTAFNLTEGEYALTVTTTSIYGHLQTCTDTISVPNIFPTYPTSTTPVSCVGGSDGTATVDIQGIDTTGITVTYLWDDPNGQTTPTATDLTDGTYSVLVTLSNGCTETLSVTVTTIPAMQADFTTVTDVTCYSKKDGILQAVVSQGTPPYSFSWDNSASTTGLADDLPVGMNSLTITDANGCTVLLSKTLAQPDPLQLVFITADTIVCMEDSLQIQAQAIGGSSPYIFTWSNGDSVVGIGSSIYVRPTGNTTTYCVELSEVCGSPTTDTCMQITLPVPVVPSLMADIYEDCVPATFHIQNTSSNMGELSSTYINFGNNSDGILLPGEDTTVTYHSIGFFDLTVTNTSIYGCKYTTSLPSFFRVNPNPVARFYVAGNPTTIFETTLQAHQLTSNDVILWEWTSAHSDPTYSNLENPIFAFPSGVVGVYPVTLKVTSYDGCMDSITLNVIVEEDILFYVPNTFTPDDDPYNQTWKILVAGGDMTQFSLEVLDRWGKLVWKTTDPNQGWDGRLSNGSIAKQDTYIWRASIKHKNDEGKTEYNGIINLLR